METPNKTIIAKMRGNIREKPLRFTTAKKQKEAIELLGKEESIKLIADTIKSQSRLEPDPTKAIKNLLKAAALYKKLGDKKSIKLAFGEIGLIFKENRKFKKAVEYFKKAGQYEQIENIAKSFERDGEFGAAALYYIEANRLSKARKFFQLLIDTTPNIKPEREIKVHEEILKTFEQEKNEVEIKNTKEKIAEIYSKMGRTTKAAEILSSIKSSKSSQANRHEAERLYDGIEKRASEKKLIERDIENIKISIKNTRDKHELEIFRTKKEVLEEQLEKMKKEDPFFLEEEYTKMAELLKKGDNKPRAQFMHKEAIEVLKANKKSFNRIEWLKLLAKHQDGANLRKEFRSTAKTLAEHYYRLAVGTRDKQKKTKFYDQGIEYFEKIGDKKKATRLKLEKEGKKSPPLGKRIGSLIFSFVS